MDFTREPVIQTVITPKEGFKLVVRSSKNSSQEEYFVDAVEVVAFGSSYFFRSLEKPKNFLLPVSDYEILEIREARMVLKHVGLDRSIKIGGGKEAVQRPQKEAPVPRTEVAEEEGKEGGTEEVAASPEGRPDRKRDRRRQGRRRRNAREEREEPSHEEGASTGEITQLGAPESEGKKVEIHEPRRGSVATEGGIVTPGMITTLLPPPPTLISETIARYREDALFKDAFYSRSEKEEEELEGFGSQEEGTEVDEDPAHPHIPDASLDEMEGNENAGWNFSEELSNHNQNNPS